MIKVKLADLTPDMKVASDVTTSEGRFLLPAGAVLTGRSIRLLKAWGVVEAAIEGDGAVPGEGSIGGLDPVFLDQAREIIERRFKHTNHDHPAMTELQKLAVLKCASALEGGLVWADPSREREIFQVSDGTSPKTLPPVNLGRLAELGFRLPTLPAVFNRINETIMNPNSSAGDIARVVSTDSGLTSQLLGIVNSAFYGFVSRIDTVSRAVAVVGTKQLTSLVFGISVIKLFDQIPAEHMDMKRFWRHSVACGIASRIIAGYKQIQNTERLFVAGLLHDIGRLLMFYLWPEHALHILSLARRDERLLYHVEREVLDIDHGGIGAHMSEQWRLPFLLESNIRYHHSPGASHNLLEASIVHLADVIVHAMDMGSSGDIFVPPLDESAWEELSISENLMAIIVEHVDRQIDEVTTYFFPNTVQED